MHVQEKAPEGSAQALAEAFAPVVSRQPTYIILDAVCQTTDTACQTGDAEIVPLAEIAAQLNDAARAQIAAAQQTLHETRTRITRERDARDAHHAELKRALEAKQNELAQLDVQRAQYEQRAHVFMNADTRERILAQIHLTFNAQQLELENAIALAQRELDACSLEHYSAIIAEELELGLLHGDIETLAQAAPEIAADLERVQAAPTHLANALQLAHHGAIAEAERELDHARSGNLPETEIAGVEQAIATAKRRALARELVAEIQNVSVELPGAVAQLKRLAQRAHELQVMTNVESFLHRVLKQARASAAARYREATLHADYLAEQGFIPCVGDGRIEAWQPTQHGWTLAQMLTYQQDCWVTHHPRARVTRTEIPRRVKRSPWYRRANAARAA